MSLTSIIYFLSLNIKYQSPHFYLVLVHIFHHLLTSTRTWNTCIRSFYVRVGPHAMKYWVINLKNDKLSDVFDLIL